MLYKNGDFMLNIQNLYQLLKEQKVIFKGCINNKKSQNWKIYGYSCNNVEIRITLDNDIRKIKIKVSIFNGKYICSCLDRVAVFQLQMLFP